MKKQSIYIFICSTSLVGCAGYDSLLLATKTNVGLDIDTQPPTAEITIARRELAIQPTYPNTKPESNITDVSGNKSDKRTKDDINNATPNALPLMAAFGIQGIFDPHITAYFAGGDAAVLLAQEISDEKFNSGICLDKKPDDTRSGIVKIWDHLLNNDVATNETNPRPFYFATDTAFGLKAAWSGTTGPYPDTIKLGYNRKEFAYAPIFVTEGCPNESQKPNQPPNNKDPYHVHSPSFLAKIDNSNTLEAFNKSNIVHTQFFATGKAATEFAKRPSVRQIAFKHMAPEAAKLELESNIPIKTMLTDISGIYNKADNTKKDSFVKKAKDLGLANEDTNSNSFISVLTAKTNNITPQIANNLLVLRQFALEEQTNTR